MSASLAQLTTLRSQHAEALLAYLSWVAGALESAEKLPAYMGGKSLAELYIDPDALKIERVTVADQGKEAGERTREQRDASAPHQEQLAPESRDIGEGQRRLREEEREVRVAWAAERDRLGFGTAGRAVIIGPPGQGKTLLARMSARQIAAGSLRILESRRALANEVALPVVVSLNALIRALPEASRPPEEALLHALRVALHESGCPARAVPHVLARVRTEHAWLLLDALDEVEKVGELPRVFVPLAEWQSRVVITSRPYGYAAQRLPFPVTEYRLAPFTPMQAEAFIERWGGDVERQARLTDLLGRSPAIAGLSQTPFLLTLLAWAGQRHEIAADTTRTRLYERIVRDLLGLIDDHSGLVDEERADSWLKLLMDLFRQHFDPASQQVAFSATGLVDTIAAHSQRPPVLGGSAVQASNLSAAEKAHYLLEELVEKRLLYPTSPARDVYSVAHKSIAEFMLGCALAGQADVDGGKGWRQIEKYIDHKAWLPQWAETIQFMAGQMADPRPLVDLLRYRRKDDAFRHRLALAGHCLAEIAIGKAERLPVQKIAAELVDLNIRHARAGTLAALAHVADSLRLALSRAMSMDGEEVTKRVLAFTLDHNPDVRSTTVEILRGVAERAEVTDRLIALLRDAEWRVRSAAVEVLQSVAARPEVVPRLTDLTHDSNSDVRSAAVKVLQRVAARANVTDRLIALLSDAEESVRSIAAQALQEGAARAEVVPRLIDLTYDGNQNVRSAAVKVLQGVAARAEVTDRLIALLSDVEESVRWAAARALRVVSGHPEVMTRLIALTHTGALPEVESPWKLFRYDGNWDIRSGAVDALSGAAQHPVVMTRLIALTHDAEWSVRWRAVKALHEIVGRPELEALLIKFPYDRDSRVQSEWVRLIAATRAAWRPEVQENLVRLLSEESWGVQSEAAQALQGAALQPQLAARLIALTDDEERWVRMAAVVALQRAAQRPEVAARLIALTYDEDTRMREEAARALQGGATHSSEVTARLIALTHDGSSDVRQSAVRALQRVAGRSEVAARLVELMHDESRDERWAGYLKQFIEYASEMERLGAAYALQGVALQPKMVARLIALTHDRHSDVRQAAAHLLADQMAQGIRVFVDWWGWRTRIRDVELLSRFD